MRDLWHVTVVPPYTAVRGPTRFVSVLGEPGRHVFLGTHTRAFLCRNRNVRNESGARVLDDNKMRGVGTGTPPSRYQ